MERTDLPSSQISAEFAIEEFRALNAEILSRVGRQNTFLGFSIAVLGLALPLAKSQSITLVTLFDAGSITFVLWAILLVLAEQDYQIASVGNYVKNYLYSTLRSSGLEPSPGWEIYISQRRGALTYTMQLSISRVSYANGNS